MFISDIEKILDAVVHLNYSDYLVFSLIRIYYQRKKQGLDIEDFVYYLHYLEEFEFDSADHMLRYLQGCLRNYLEPKNENKIYNN